MSLAGAVALMYLVLTPVHLLVLERSAALVMAPFAAVSAVVCYLLYRFGRRPDFLSVNPLAFLMVIIIAVNSTLHQALDGRLVQTTNIAFLIVGLGALFLDRRWLIASYLLCLMLWALAGIRDDGQGDWAHFTIALAFAVFLSSIIYRVRKDDTMRLAEAASQLAEMARHDGLTALANRRELHEQLGKLSASAARTRKPLALLICDLDNFKSYNDTRGHLAGDELLKKVAGALQEVARRSLDVVARWGGDEFVIILPDTGADEAALVAERVCAGVRAIGARTAGPDGGDPITVSVGGVSECPVREGVEGFSDSLLEAADKAMYLAKQRGGDSFCMVEDDSA